MIGAQNKRNLLSYIFIVVMAFYGNNILSAEIGVSAAVRIAEEEAAALGGRVSQEALAVMREGFENAYGTVEKLSPELEAQMRSQIKTAMENAIKEPGFELNMAKFKTDFKVLADESKVNFFKNAEKIDLSMIGKNELLNKVNLKGVGRDVIEQIKTKPPKPAEVTQLPLRNVKMEVETEIASVAHDDVIVAQDNLKDAYIKGNDVEISTAKKDLKTAQDDYKTKAENAKKAVDAKSTAADSEYQQMEYKLKKGDASVTKEDVANAKKASQNNAATKEELGKKQASQEYKQAKAEKEVADADYEAAKKYSKDETRIKEAKKTADEKGAAVEKAKKELLDKTGWFENKSLRAWENTKKRFWRSWNKRKSSRRMGKK